MATAFAVVLIILAALYLRAISTNNIAVDKGERIA